ncbi:MAG: hypothetical protein CVV24_00085 [Ignavibacteriae bacterium HGW-Ignavibacteriae-3]|nr:MAG: hypothetical protein CVV24_00085 [Ignavibacteriae bacterium HGW-Ignavibacteriae-3]
MKKLCVFLYFFLLMPSINAQSSSSNNILDNVRAIHIGGNWGRNPLGIPQQPEEYYQFLKNISVNWAAINIGLHVNNSMDAVVKKVYDNVPIPTFRDATLRDAIRGFRNHNINVMLTMAVETQEAAQSSMPVNRWQFGDPNMAVNDPNISAANWPWDTNHPQHSQFVDSWWQSYTNEVVYFAKIAQQEDVKMFAVGAETDRLFRTRSGGLFPNHFNNQIKALVDSVRKYYSGLITYELHWSALTDPGFYGPGSDNLWSDAGFDVVGVSAYFRLVEQQPARVLGVDELEAGWNNIFTSYLIPLKNRNPGKKIVFHEFGYNDHVASPYNPIFEEFSQKAFKDNNVNGKDDGEEQQANILDAFYHVNETHGRLVSGTFLWDNYICSNTDWSNSFGAKRMCSIRNKIAENIVGRWYTTYTPLPGAPSLLSPLNGAQNVSIQNILLEWAAADEAVSYEVRVSDKNDFSTNIVTASNLSSTSYNITASLNPSTTYYWAVRSNNLAGTSNWSTALSFTTVALPAAPALMSPQNGDVNIPLQNVLFEWAAVSEATTYALRVSDKIDFSSPLISASDISNTSHSITTILNPATKYYWSVKSKNSIGESAWSQTFSFTTGSLPIAPALISPPNNAKNIPTSAELRWFSSFLNYTYEIHVAENQSFNPALINKAGLSGGTYQLTNLSNSKTYYWRVRATNNFGTGGWSQVFNFETTAAVSVKGEEIPLQYKLEQNYPNPFNPITEISYQLKSDGFVDLCVYDLVGTKVRTLLKSYQRRGNYTIEFDGANLPSAVYFYKLQVNEFISVKKMMLMK